MIVAEDSPGLGKKQRFYREIVSTFVEQAYSRRKPKIVFMKSVKDLIRKMKTF